MRRRQFLMGASALAAGGLLAPAEFSAFATSVVSFVAGPPVPDQPLRQISPHVFVIEAPDGFPTPANQGLMANITFIAGRDGAVVFDSGASLQIGQMAVRQWRATSSKPITAIINSHFHGDHWLGNQAFTEAFGAELPIYAHPYSRTQMAGLEGNAWLEAMAKWTNGATLGTRIILPNRDAVQGGTLSLGDITLRFHHYGTAHTPGDVCVEVVEDQVMCVGDVLMDRRIANMEDGSYAGSFTYFDALEANSKTKIWLPGHGTPSAAVMTWQRSLFQGIYEPCLAAVKAGDPVEVARKAVLADPRVASKAQDTKGFETNIGKYISIAYLEAEQAAF